MDFKITSLYLIFLANNFGHAHECRFKDQINESQEKLEDLLTFIEKRYYQFNFDGLLGVVLAEGILLRMFMDFKARFIDFIFHLVFVSAQLLEIDRLNLTINVKKRIDLLMERCQAIKREILPLLPRNPQYMIICEF